MVRTMGAEAFLLRKLGSPDLEEWAEELDGQDITDIMNTFMQNGEIVYSVLWKVEDDITFRAQLFSFVLPAWCDFIVKD